MEPFDTPANRPTFTDPATLWMGWPAAAYAASVDLAVRQWEAWASVQRAMLDAGARTWTAGLTPVDAPAVDAPSPPVALAALDLRDTSEAVLRAQMDAVNALQRSA
jgi:hypothetical protein